MKNWENIDELLKKTEVMYSQDDINDLADIAGNLPYGSGDVRVFRYVVGEIGKTEHYNHRFALLAEAIGGERMMKAIQKIMCEDQERLLAAARREAYDKGYEAGTADVRISMRSVLGL
jgi:hypothetical protein